jgi:periplasmic protein TonB
MALHAGLLVLALLLATTRPPPPLPQVLSVRLLAPSAAGSAAAPVPAAEPVVAAAPSAAVPVPPPKVAPAPPKPKAVSLKPIVKPAPAPVPKPAEVKPAEPPPVAAPASATIGTPSPTPSVGAGGSGSSIELAGLGPGAGGAPNGSPGGTEDPIEVYKALVRARIEAERRYSPMARRRGLEGVVNIRVSIGPSGAVSRVSVEDGAPMLLAKSTEEAVARAGPFPPPPTGLGVLRVPVRYRLDD